MTYLKRRKRQRANIRTEPRIRCPGHLAWVRGHVCAVPRGHDVKADMHDGRIQAAHVRYATDGAAGVKPGDNWTVPLCAAHHHEQHAIGEWTFEARYQFDMKALAAQLWARSPHRLRWENRQGAA